MDTSADAGAAGKPSLEALVGEVREAHARGDISTAAVAAVLKLQPDKADEAEFDFEVLENPSRVLRSQERFCSLLPASRYEPVAKGRTSGVIMLKDTAPDAEEELLPLPAALAAASEGADEEEPAPPEPFELPA